MASLYDGKMGIFEAQQSTNIIVESFQDCMCFVVLIMECGFYILPQGTTFADILLLKCSFREASGYF